MVDPEGSALLRLHAAGKISPLPVALPPLPAAASPAMVDVAEFYRLMRGLRLAADDPRDVPFAQRWVAREVGWPPATVHRVLGKLVEHGVLLPGEELPARTYGRGTQCYRPGVATARDVDELAERRRSRRRDCEVNDA